jgi:hypothetical protein
MFKDENFRSHCMLLLSDGTYVRQQNLGGFVLDELDHASLIDELDGVLTFVNGIRDLFTTTANFAAVAAGNWGDTVSGINSADALTFAVGSADDLENSVWISHWLADDDADDAFNSGAVLGLAGAQLKLFSGSQFDASGHVAVWTIPSGDLVNGAKSFDSAFTSKSFYPQSTQSAHEDWDNSVSSMQLFPS